MLHQRNEPLEPYYHAWEWVSVRNNLGVKLLNEVDRKVCAFTGKYGPLEKAHILPISNAYTKALEFWMTELKLFPREPKDIQRAKVHQRNLVHMNLDLCYYMQPTRPNFLFMPTRETLLALIKHFEAGLHAASQSESSFLGFHSGNLLSSWPHYIVNNKAYEYEGWHISTADFEMDLTYHLTFKVIDNNEKRTYFSRDDSIETNPLQFQPELPSVWLVLSPFNVLLNTWKALYRIRETLHLSPEHNERLFVLGEYALELAECDGADAFRNLKRPECLDFPLPPPVKEPNMTFRFPIVEEDGSPKRKKEDSESPDSSKSKKRAIIKSRGRKEGKANASREPEEQEEEQPRRRRSERLRKATERHVTPPSPGLSSSSSNVDTSFEESIKTPEDEAVATFPSTDLYKTPSRDTDSYKTPSRDTDWNINMCKILDLPNEDRIAHLERWEASLIQRLDAITSEIIKQVVPDGQMSSKSLRDLRYFTDTDLEQRLQNAFELLENIVRKKEEVQAQWKPNSEPA